MKKNLKIALVGNPNSGKSSLFNALTGLRQKVSNYPGVTVDKKIGTCSINNSFIAEIIDLPGTYSIYPKSVDEQIVLNLLCNKNDKDHPDLIIAVIDASSLKRNLLFASQIIDLKIPVIIALNMVDVAKEKGAEIDAKKLSAQLGVKVIPINARENKGISELKKAIFASPLSPSPKERGEYFIGNHFLTDEASFAIKKIIPSESEYTIFQIANHYQKISHLDSTIKNQIENILGQFTHNFSKQQAEETLKRYNKINLILENCVQQSDKNKEHILTNKIDKILTHKILGYVFFLLIMFTIFQSIFAIAKFPMNWISNGFSLLNIWLQNILPHGRLTDLFTQGILSGVGAIAVFIPQIMILFGFLTILEDTGYLSRISFIMDKLMRKIGMNGKSVIPLMSGFACAIPAIMSARNIENWKDRMITILVTPLMSCSARLPVYTLLIAMVVPDKFVFGIFNLQGLVLMGLYLLGFVMAIFVAIIMRLFIKAKEKGYFIMEMPIYRMPRWANVFFMMMEKAKIFVVDAGKVILLISVILWFLASFAPGDAMKNIELKYSDLPHPKSLSKEDGFLSSSPLERVAGDEAKMKSEKLEASYAGILGKFIEPAIQPLGFDWKIGIALITSFAAREVFVGTMATIYSIGGENPDPEKLKGELLKEKNPVFGTATYSFATAFSLMIFYAFAMQCMSTVAVVRRETKSWKWAIILISYMTSLAYVGSLMVFQILK